MQVVREFRITRGNFREREGGKGGWRTDGQRTNMMVKTMNTNKLLGWGETSCFDSTGDAKSSIDDAARDSEEEPSHH